MPSFDLNLDDIAPDDPVCHIGYTIRIKGPRMEIFVPDIGLDKKSTFLAISPKNL